MQNDNGRVQKGDGNTTEGTNRTPGTNGARQTGLVPEWWRVVPTEEKAVIRVMLGSARVLKRNASWKTIEAARKWDRKVTCFIMFQLMGGAGRWQRHQPKAETLKTESRNGNRR